ncbi:MAG: hypothetical protein M1608_17410 [Candidatus Omnitrophica bacterium]|nr:hypothetical protein [Candidatus Omnitrophota bacterium]
MILGLLAVLALPFMLGLMVVCVSMLWSGLPWWGFILAMIFLIANLIAYAIEHPLSGHK